MAALTFIVPGTAAPQGRTRRGRGHGKPVMHGRSRSWRKFAADRIALEWAQSGAERALRELVRVDIVIVKARPESRPELVPELAWARGTRVFGGFQGDKDNFDKAAFDALKDAGVIRNDHLVADGRTQKLYAAVGEDPCVEINVSSVWEVR